MVLGTKRRRTRAPLVSPGQRAVKAQTEELRYWRLDFQKWIDRQQAAARELVGLTVESP